MKNKNKNKKMKCRNLPNSPGTQAMVVVLKVANRQTITSRNGTTSLYKNASNIPARSTPKKHRVKN
jgi:hypothetical protein